MTGLPLNWTPPPRSLLYARPAEGGGLEIGCDCGTVTHLIIDGTGQLTGTVEMSFTCDCLSVHWFTVGPGGAS